MSSMDRMLLDLNLPPPAHWSPPAVPVISPSSDGQPPSPSPDSESRKSHTDLLEPSLKADGAGSPSGAEEAVAEGVCSLPDVEVGESLPSDPTSAIQVVLDVIVGANDSNPGSSSPSTTGTLLDPVPENEVNGKGSDPSLAPAVHVVGDVGDQAERRSRSVLEDSYEPNPPEEGFGDRGGGNTKVRKRLRTLGQLSGRKLEKNAVAPGPQIPQNLEILEDEIGGDRAQEAALASVVSPRISSQLRSKKGERAVTASNGDSTTSRRNATSDPPVKDGGGGSQDHSDEQEPFLPGRFAKVPSQPRSRKTEKRANLVPPIVVSDMLRLEEEVVIERKATGGSVSGKVIIEDKLMIDNVEEGKVGVVKAEKSVEIKEPPRTPSEALPQSVGGKRPGVGLKDAMPGKKRRQTVLLEVDESLKQARPLRTPTSEGAQGRIVRTRREIPRPFLSQVPEKQENQSNDGATTSSGLTEASMSRKAEDLTDELEKLDRNSNSQPNESPGQFRRPILRRQISSLSGRDDKSGKGGGGSSFSRLDSARSLDSFGETRLLSNLNEGSAAELQKRRKVPRKTTDVKKQAAEPKDASIERLHREATCCKLWQTSGLFFCLRPLYRFRSSFFDPLLFCQ